MGTCKNGHLQVEGVYTTHTDRNGRKRWVCLACRRESSRRYRIKHASEERKRSAEYRRRRKERGSRHVSVLMDADTAFKFREICKHRGQSVTYVVTAMVEAYIDAAGGPR